MNPDALKTIKATILYILKHSDVSKCDIYGIVKTAFFAQQINLAEWGVPLYEDEICALPFGPVPSAIYDILKMARGDTNIFSRNGFDSISKSIGCVNETFLAREEPDMDWLSQCDVKSLDKAIAKVSKMSFNDIKDLTHNGEEYQRAIQTSGKRRMYEIAIARDGGADETAIEHLKNYLETVKLLS